MAISFLTWKLVLSNIRAAKLWILIAPLAFLFIVWFIMKQKKLAVHLFTSFCISSNFLLRAGFFRSFYKNLEWLHYWHLFRLSHNFKTTDRLDCSKILHRLCILKIKVKKGQNIEFSNKNVNVHKLMQHLGLEATWLKSYFSPQTGQ